MGKKFESFKELNPPLIKGASNFINPTKYWPVVIERVMHDQTNCSPSKTR